MLCVLEGALHCAPPCASSTQHICHGGQQAVRCTAGRGSDVVRRAMSLPFPPPEPLPPPLAMRTVPDEVVSVELANLGLMTPEEEQSNQQLLYTVRTCMPCCLVCQVCDMELTAPKEEQSSQQLLFTLPACELCGLWSHMP